MYFSLSSGLRFNENKTRWIVLQSSHSSIWLITYWRFLNYVQVSDTCRIHITRRAAFPIGSWLDTSLRNRVVLSVNLSPVCSLKHRHSVQVYISRCAAARAASSGTLSRGGYLLPPPCLRPVFFHSPIHLSLHFHLSLSISPSLPGSPG